MKKSMFILITLMSTLITQGCSAVSHLETLQLEPIPVNKSLEKSETKISKEEQKKQEELRQKSEDNFRMDSIRLTFDNLPIQEKIVLSACNQFQYMLQQNTGKRLYCSQSLTYSNVVEVSQDIWGLDIVAVMRFFDITHDDRGNAITYRYDVNEAQMVENLVRKYGKTEYEVNQDMCRQQPYHFRVVRERLNKSISGKDLKKALTFTYKNEKESKSFCLNNYKTWGMK